ncbi:MAG: carbamoyltransferase C-terminal domain-containing protein, partial [Candidatus Sungiibacteriota bacterium]
INHHDAHAASAFFASPFEESAVLVYDGAGEKFETHLGVAAVETETLYRGIANQLYPFQKTLHLRDNKHFPFTFGIGKLYAFLSQFYLGFGAYNEGKMMGLAPYGDDSLLTIIPTDKWYQDINGHIVCNARIHIPKRPVSTRAAGLFDFKTLPKKIYLKAALAAKSLIKKVVFALNKKYLRGYWATPHIFDPIILPRPPRTAADALPDRYYASVAYAGQKILEQVAIAWGKKLKAVTQSDNLCVAGGVGLNIDANKSFLDRAGFKDIFIQPGCSDAGIALGCALFGYHTILNQPRFWTMRSAALGRPYTEQEILAAIEKRKSEIMVKKSPHPAAETARLISEGKIIGWFYGGSEYGPRALGNRSILCDARIPEIKDILNNKVKHRESWRPFAASVLREDVAVYFELDRESPFMLLAAPVRPVWQKKIPAVTHIDGTSRIQTVTHEHNGRYYDMIAAFKEITGIGIILNTSFNLGGEPIVETPDDALSCFLNTQMDCLILEEYIIRKK